MSTTQIIILAFAGIGLFGALAIVSVAWRRSADEGETGRPDGPGVRERAITGGIRPRLARPDPGVQPASPMLLLIADPPSPSGSSSQLPIP